MKKNFVLVGLLGICILAVLITQLPFAGFVSAFLPGLVIFTSALLICRRRLRVGSVILCAVLSLAVLPVAVYILVSVGGMLLMGVMPLWLNGILSCVLQYAVSLAVFALACRILHRGKIGGVRGIHVLIVSVLAVASAVLEEASYGFVSELPTAAAIEMLMFLSSRNPVLGFLSQAAFYGAIFFMGYVVWRSVSREDSDAQEIQ